MLLRYNETMPVVSRIDVHESERVVVLQQFEAWHLPDNDFAENAVVIRSTCDSGYTSRLDGTGDVAGRLSSSVPNRIREGHTTIQIDASDRC